MHVPGKADTHQGPAPVTWKVLDDWTVDQDWPDFFFFKRMHILELKKETHVSYVSNFLHTSHGHSIVCTHRVHHCPASSQQ